KELSRCGISVENPIRQRRSAMNISGNSVGIDYHDGQVQVSVLASGGEQLGNRRLANDTSEVISFISRFGEVKEVALAARNGAGSFADQVAWRGNYRVRVGYAAKPRLLRDDCPARQNGVYRPTSRSSAKMVRHRPPEQRWALVEALFPPPTRTGRSRRPWR